MSSDPTDVALREIMRTRRLLEALVTSSESFDYWRAKATLEELNVKMKALARLHARMRAADTEPTTIVAVPTPPVS